MVETWLRKSRMIWKTTHLLSLELAPIPESANTAIIATFLILSSVCVAGRKGLRLGVDLTIKKLGLHSLFFIKHGHEKIAIKKCEPMKRSLPVYRRGRGSGVCWSTGSCRTDPVVFLSVRRRTRPGRPCTSLPPRSWQVQPASFFTSFLLFFSVYNQFALGLYTKGFKPALLFPSVVEKRRLHSQTQLRG
jgi:hypothetical protein